MSVMQKLKIHPAVAIKLMVAAHQQNLLLATLSAAPLGPGSCYTCILICQLSCTH